MRISAAIALAFGLLLAPRLAAAQGSEATGIGVGVQAMLPSDPIDVGGGLGPAFTIPFLGGPAVTYQAPKFHIDGILAFFDNDAITVIGAGGRFFYELHSTQASDLSVGGGIGFLNIDFGPDSTTEINFEAGAKIRAFLAPSVAFNASVGLGLLSGDADFIAFTGQLVGGIGLTYFFF